MAGQRPMDSNKRPGGVKGLICNHKTSRLIGQGKEFGDRVPYKSLLEGDNPCLQLTLVGNIGTQTHELVESNIESLLLFSAPSFLRISFFKTSTGSHACRPDSIQAKRQRNGLRLA
jgi:hypothetical protein